MCHGHSHGVYYHEGHSYIGHSQEGIKKGWKNPSPVVNVHSS